MSYKDRPRANQLVASTEWVSSQTNESCSCKSTSPFTMGFSSLYDYVIHVGLIVASFQGPALSRLRMR